jgi:hypothetical protein
LMSVFSWCCCTHTNPSLSSSSPLSPSDNNSKMIKVNCLHKMRSVTNN